MRTLWASGLVVLVAGMLGAAKGQVGGPEVVTVKPADSGVVLVNPSMGWVLYFYSNVPSNYGSKLEPCDTVDEFPGISAVYLRVPWAFLEPQEGKFNWALLDTPAQRWIAKGKQIALRITCSENWTRFATPEWVKQAGAKGTFYKFGSGPAEDGGAWDPDYLDPIFLAKLDNFLAALGARYEGNPNVAYIDVGTFGLWGEGHTFMSSQVPDERVPEIVAKHADLHRKHFPNTLLCISDDVVGHDRPGARFDITDDLLAKNVGFRDDSIMVQPPPRSWYHAELAQSFWPRLPVILEHEHFGSSQKRDAWGDGSLLVKAVEDHHASYLSIHWWPREFLTANRPIIDRINLRLGYRLQLRQITWPAEVRIGQPFEVAAEWANAGVAPFYPGGHMALTLKDEKGGIVSVQVDEQFNMRNLKVGPPEHAPVSGQRFECVVGKIAPATKPGDYEIYVSVGLKDGTPQIALPLPNDDGQRRYKLGRITLQESKK